MAIETVDERQVQAPPRKGVDRQVHVALKSANERLAIDIRDHESKGSFWQFTSRGVWLPVEDGTATDVLEQYADLLGYKLVKKTAARKPAAKKTARKSAAA